MSEFDPVPLPVLVEVCSMCGEDWGKHLRLVRHFDDEDVEWFGPVGLFECVRVLGRRFEGPVGPVGPMGAAGLDAR